MPMNKMVVRRMIRRIGSIPYAYKQSAWFIQADDETPCGTVACLAGEAVICSKRTIKQGIAYALQLNAEGWAIVGEANKLLGLPDDHPVFAADASGWPKPFNTQFKAVESQAEKAKVAVAYLKEALKRGTMIWEESS